jgi:hypothetical protein
MHLIAMIKSVGRLEEWRRQCKFVKQNANLENINGLFLEDHAYVL